MTLASIADDIRAVFEHHAPEIERATAAVEAVTANPLAQSVLAAAHIPPGVIAGLADFVNRAEAEFAALESRHAQAVADAHAAGHAEGVAAAQPQAAA